MLTIRYFAAARAAAGTQTESIPLAELADHTGAHAGTGEPAGTSARDALISLLSQRHPEPPPGEPALSTVLAQSTFLVNGVSLHQSAGSEAFSAGDRVDVLPPFAGG